MLQAWEHCSNATVLRRKCVREAKSLSDLFHYVDEREPVTGGFETT